MSFQRNAIRHINPHERCVRAWLASNRVEASDQQRMASLLLTGLHALWERARPSLGETTVAVIFARVVATARRRHPELAGAGLRVHGVTHLVMDEPPALASELTHAAAFVVTEALEVIARHTAGALTGGLHAALAAATLEAEERPAPSLAPLRGRVA